MGINVASSFTRNAPVPIDDLFVVADLTARDDIPDGVRYEGMFVYVESEGANYQLVGGITDGDWVDFGSGGSGGGSGNMSDYSTDSVTPANDGFESDIPVKKFSYLEQQSFFFYIPLVGYDPGEQISLVGLRFFVNSTSTNNVLFRAETKLVKVGGNASSLTNTHVSTNTQQVGSGSANAILSVGDLDLTDADGEINNVAVADGDGLLVRIYRDIANESVPLDAEVNLLVKHVQLQLKAP